MPPKSKRQKKNEKVAVAHEPDPAATALDDIDHIPIHDIHTKKDRVTQEDPPRFDALRFLQTQI
jgi:hypothetical protein